MSTTNIGKILISSTLLSPQGLTGKQRVENLTNSTQCEHTNSELHSFNIIYNFILGLKYVCFSTVPSSHSIAHRLILASVSTQNSQIPENVLSSYSLQLFLGFRETGKHSSQNEGT